MDRPNYQRFLSELAAGSTHGIFVDDTGSPGIKNAPPNFHPERKSWVAVVVLSELMPEILEQFPRAVQTLHELVGADEFHFTDIYSGTRQFKGVDLQVRLALFEFMAHMFSCYKFPVVVQTFDPDTLAHIRSRGDERLPDAIPPFDLTQVEDAALLFLLLRLKRFMENGSTSPKVRARVFIDEGYKSNGAVLKIPTFETVFCDGSVCFAKSSAVLPLQLADFAAFALNRSQLIGGRERRTTLDNRVLEILSSVAFNYINLDQKTVRLTDDGPLITLVDTRPHGPP